MRLAALAGRPSSRALADACAQLPPGPEDYRQLAVLLAHEWAAGGVARVGLSGGQGAGKSTLAALVVQACNARGLRSAALCLDDFYLTKAERGALARRVHPLFETRGPPGTHDVARCQGSLQALLGPGPVELPTFDKGLDDRAGKRRLRGPFDLVLLEGWCIGAAPLAPETLHEPINALERERDAEGRWRRHLASELAGPYQALFAQLDALVYLEVPDLAAVRRWRLQQERERPAPQRLSPEAVDLFVAHYERVTRAMLADLPTRADVLVRLDADHRVAALRFQKPPPDPAEIRAG